MSLKVVIPPQHYPVTLEEAKKQLGYYHSEDDDQVLDYVVDATAEAEHYTGIRSLFTTVEQVFDCFPRCTLELRGIPFVKLESIKYYDSDDALQTLATSTYRVDSYAEFARLEPVNSWPSTKARINAVIVRYVVGYAGVCTASTGSNLINIAGHPFADGDEVLLWKATEATLPNGVTANKKYYVVNANADDLQLSLTEGGSAINITTNGSGQFYIGFRPVPRQMTAAIKKMVSDLEQFRGDHLTGTIVQSVPGSIRLLNQIKPKRL